MNYDKYYLQRSTPEEEEEKNRRTIFVGNVPITSKSEKVANYFKKFGEDNCSNI